MKFSTPKLFDCKSHGERSELFIVEGDSAARSVKRIRDRAFQAILPMQGKPMNAIKANLDDLQNNIQFAALIDALGVELSEDELPGMALAVRYQKIILLFDPDADGIHGRTLMLLFFYRWLKPLLDAGRVFDAHAPQWEIVGDGLSAPAYAGTPDHLQEVRDALRDQGVGNIKSKRFRGLGSIEPDILRTQCVDPATRRLSVLSADHARYAIDFFEQLRPDSRED